MTEVLPVKLLTDQDVPFFGPLPVALGKLERAGFSTGGAIAVTPPELKLKTTLEQFDFGTKEVFTQSLTLLKKEIEKIPVPEILIRETGRQKEFLLDGEVVKSVKSLWQQLLSLWLLEIKKRLWDNGFYTGIAQGLRARIVIFSKKPKSRGTAYFDNFGEKTVVNVKEGKLKQADFDRITGMVRIADKKLFMPYEYEWIEEGGIKLCGLKPYTFSPELIIPAQNDAPCKGRVKIRSAVKIFYDLSQGFIIQKEVDGIYIASEKIFNLNKPRYSYDEMVLKLVESAHTFADSPVLFKLADMEEGMGKVRGCLRLLHQKSLLDPMLSALDFARHKRGLLNVHIVIPFVRGVGELLQIKRELAVKKLMRKNSLQMWLETAVPENILNLQDYLIAGIDGVVLNMDELVAHLNGFDPKEAELAFYKNEVDGLLIFLYEGIRFLHKAKIPFIACGSLAFYPKVLEYLVEKGVYGIVAQSYDAHSAYELLHQTERRMILRRS